jgi:hypothetical protein
LAELRYYDIANLMSDIAIKRFHDGMMMNSIGIKHYEPSSLPNTFVEFNYGSTGDYEYKLGSGILFNCNKCNPTFTVVYDGCKSTYIMPYSKSFISKAFEILVSIFGTYPKTMYNCWDKTPWHVGNFIEYPDYDFASIWVNNLTDLELEFVFNVLDDPSLNNGPYVDQKAFIMNEMNNRKLPTFDIGMLL